METIGMNHFPEESTVLSVVKPIGTRPACCTALLSGLVLCTVRTVQWLRHYMYTV